MNCKLQGNLYKKNGYYYARIYYYIDGIRKTKDKATKIPVESTSSRKAKQQERAANQFLSEFLRTFTPPETADATPAVEQMFTETIDSWLLHVSGSKAPSTLASYAYIAKDITLYFNKVAPIRTVDLTTTHVEAYLSWERRRRQPEYQGEYKVLSRYADGSGIENTVHHRYTALRNI